MMTKLPDDLDLKNRPDLIKYILEQRKEIRRPLKQLYRMLNNIASDVEVSDDNLYEFDWVAKTPSDLRERLKSLDLEPQSRYNIMSSIRKLLEALSATDPEDKLAIMELLENLEFEKPKKDHRMKEQQGAPYEDVSEFAGGATDIHGEPTEGTLLNVGKESGYQMEGELTSEQEVRLSPDERKPGNVEYSPTVSTRIVEESSAVRRFLTNVADGTSNILGQAGELANMIYRKPENIIRYFRGKSTDDSS